MQLARPFMQSNIVRAASAHWNTILNVRRFHHSSASRDLQGYTGETGVKYNQTDFSRV